MARIIGFLGQSNSGKTTLISRLCKELKEQEAKILVIKHDPKAKSTTDTKGKDSWVFFESGADVILASSQKTTIFKQDILDEKTALKMYEAYDYVFVEGFKTWCNTKILVANSKLFQDERADLIAYKDIDKSLLPTDKPAIFLDDIKTILKWINNGKN